MSCACHWTVNVAASNGHAKLYADVYSVAPAGHLRALGFSGAHPADLAGVPISVGFQSGSHYSTIQALEQYMAPGEINLTFEDGMLFHRMELLIEGKSPAAALFNGPYYLAEQLGFRKVIDTTFMIAAMIKGEVDPEDVRRYFRALRRAQRDIDLRPERTRTTTRTNSRIASMPSWIRAVGVRASGSCSRPIRRKYSSGRSTGSRSTRSLPEGRMGSGEYERSIISFAAE